MTAKRYERELFCALEAASAAAKLQLDLRGKTGPVERKSDASPVTAVDKKCEAIIRARLLKKFKQDGFLGEESGKSAGRSGRIWVVDPLDGTRPYLRGIPTHSVLIALLENNDPVLGVMALPALSLVCYADSLSVFCARRTSLRASRMVLP
ncbi:MAG: hypothetical protein PHC61_18300, partial [Chitinivibrionales bacterium]|nr:hypothetical protein [Chitinivibrionales bacterium]